MPKLVKKSKVYKASNKVDWNKVQSDPEYKKFDWKMYPQNLSII
jgi:hypothetical protein